MILTFFLLSLRLLVNCLTNVRVPQFVDFEETFDFQSSMNVIRAAEEAFNAMPAEVRDRFRE